VPAGRTYFLNTSQPAIKTVLPGPKAMHQPKPAKTGLLGLYLRNVAANLSGNFIIAVLNFYTPLAVFEEWREFLSAGGWVAIPIIIACIALFGIFLQYLAQRPITALLGKIHLPAAPDPALQARARRRLLNLPIILALVNLSMWVVLSAVFLPIMYLLINMTLSSFLYAFFRIVMIGLIASFISFFLLDDYSRKKLVPIFFPHGKLAAVPGTVKISILRRIRVLLGVGTNAPMVLLVGTLAFAVWEVQDRAVSAGQFGKQILIFTVAVSFLGTDGIWEARNPRGDMFGKNRIHRIIRQNHQASAKEILTECFRALNRFMENHAPEDDVTMIVIKMIDD